MLRKKRVTITEQAQAAIAAGMPVDQALTEHGVIDPAAESGETPTDEVEDTESEETTSSSTEEEETPTAAEDESTEVTDTEEETEEPVAAEAAPGMDQAAFTSVLDRLQTSQNTVATQSAEIDKLKADLEQATATQAGLMEVTVNAVHRMQVGLGGAASDLSQLSAENLLATYRSTLTLFEKRLPVGGKAEVLIDDGSHDKKKVVPLVPPAAARATQIRK